MTKIESNIAEIANSQENVFKFLADFNNFGKMMPPQVAEWRSTADECSFVISGMAKIGMKIVERKPHDEIHIVSAGEKIPLKFDLFIRVVATGENTCKGQLVFESDMNPMIKMMVEKPLTNFFNLLASKMKDIRQDS